MEGSDESSKEGCIDSREEIPRCFEGGPNEL